MPQWKFIGKDGQEQRCEPLSFGPNGEPVWYPMIPYGSYISPEGEYFEFGPRHAAEMVAQMKQGLPNAQGIPGDEMQNHQKYPMGAFHTAIDLEAREQEGLYALIEPTKEGLANLKNLPYVSPNFTVGDGESPNFPGRRNFLEAFAMCSSPWFYGQPGLTLPPGARVMASMSTVGGVPPAGTDTEHPTGGVAMTPEELQAKIDELTAALATKDEELVAKGTEIEGLQAQITERDEKITGLETAQTEAKTEAEKQGERITALETAAVETAREAHVKSIVDELTGTVLEEDDADGEKRHAQYTPEAVKVLAALQTDPGAESSTAFMAHITAHGGKPQTVSVDDKPALRPITAAMGGDAGLTDEQKLETLPDEDATKTRRIMSRENCGYEEARRRLYEEHRPL